MLDDASLQAKARRLTITLAAAVRTFSGIRDPAASTPQTAMTLDWTSVKSCKVRTQEGREEAGLSRAPSSARNVAPPLCRACRSSSFPRRWGKLP